MTAVVTLGRNEPTEIKTRIEMGFEPNSLSILAVPGKTLTPHALKQHSKRDIVVYTCTRISITYSFILKISSSEYGDIDTHYRRLISLVPKLPCSRTQVHKESFLM